MHSCFNPCKGFGGFGTISLEDFIRQLDVSIPVRVLGVLELLSAGADYREWTVSIPVRVLGVLEPTRQKRNRLKLARFNPCKGFGGFGTWG